VILENLFLEALRLELFSVVRKIVEAGYDPQYNKYALRSAAGYSSLEIVQYLVSVGLDPRYDGDIALIYAVEEGRLETVKYLISVGCDPRSCEGRAEGLSLRYATNRGHTEVVKYIKSEIAKVSV
jgi:ankyrin repeat protein